MYERSTELPVLTVILYLNQTAMAEKHQDQDFVEFVVRSLVDNPDSVSTERTVDERGVLITLKTDQKDLGQIIGRGGQTARAIRTLLRVVGAKHQARVNLKIWEPEGSRPRQPQPPINDQQNADTSAIDDLNI